MVDSIALRNDVLQKALSDTVYSNISGYDVPNQLGKTIIPVLVTNPPNWITIIKNASLYYSGSEPLTTTIYTTPNDRDFYLVGRMINFTNKINPVAPGNPTYCRIDIVLPDGTAATCLIVSGLDNINADKIIEQSSASPIRLKRNSAITFTASVGGTMYATANITGFTADSYIY